ncbi:MAG: phosphatase PAP2 family protein [Fusobacterium sp.]|nr:phosphatase PAP2 family protein [Fusobacterium sp.]MDO4690688.1 phosphatase PAP2 family protein [Fusobacterium sp.]
MKKQLLKLKIKYMLFSSFLFVFLYKSAEFYTKTIKEVSSIVMSWEKNIPFIPILIVPYMTSGLLFSIIFLLPKNKNNLILLFKRANFMTILSSSIFFIYPLKFSFTKPIVENTIYRFLFFLLKVFDSDFNQCPSLHVSYALLYITVFYKELKSPFKYLACFWAFLIAISVIFVYQHHFIDFLAAIVVIAITFFIFPDKIKKKYIEL